LTLMLPWGDEAAERPPVAALTGADAASAPAASAAVAQAPVGPEVGAVAASPPGASAPASSQDDAATPEALFREAQRHQSEGRWSEAEALYASVLAQHPTHWPSWLERGVAAFQVGRRNEAIAHLRRALEIEPRFARTQLALGTFIAMGGQPAEAEPHLRRAVELDPANTEARFNLGKSLQDQGDPVAAEAIYRDVLRAEPQHHLAKLNLANALFSQWRDAEALPLYREAAAQIADPYVHTNLAMMLSYSPAHGDAEVFEAHRDFDRRLVAPLAATAPPHANRPDPERRLRVAYLSRDLCRHSMRYFLVPLVAHHDHAAFEIGFYNFGDKSDEITDFYRRRADRWVDCHGWSDERLAARIRDDGIDILVELSGHTDRNRLLVVGRHPAPVQITYLGYPTTTGVGAIDYRISDRWIDPEPGQGPAIASTETPLRLAHGYFCYSPVPGSPKVGPLPLERHGHVTFGSLNQGPKLNPPLFESWAEILRRLPQSRLVIQNKAMAEGIPRERVQGEFARLGIDPARLDFRPFGKAPAYLGTYHDIDIALDSHPYNGGTTTCEALWMGVPVVSRAGSRHVARLGMSILNQIGLPELVAADAAGYIDTAVALAGDAERLRTLRTGMRERLLHSPLMDHPGFTRELEGAYRAVWRRWCAGRSSA
jgi:protein O-GlcNAc transferase